MYKGVGRYDEDVFMTEMTFGPMEAYCWLSDVLRKYGIG